MNLDWKREYSQYHRYLFGPEEMTQAVEKRRSYVWLSLTIFTVCFFLIVAIQPTLLTIAKLNSEIKKKTEASQKLQVKINSLVAAQSVFAKNTDNFPLLDDALPEKSEFPRLAYFFEEMATSSGVSLNSLMFERIEELTQNPMDSALLPRRLKFSLKVSGEYPRLKDFLINLESSRRVLNIGTSSFSQSKKEDIVEILLFVSGQASFGK